MIEANPQAPICRSSRAISARETAGTERFPEIRRLAASPSPATISSIAGCNPVEVAVAELEMGELVEMRRGGDRDG